MAETQPVPSPNRRREIASMSARSLLLTILGEFVHPRGRPVWTATLIEAMATLGIEEKSARQALARTASEGLLTSIRDGRRVQWALTAHGDTLLREGTDRIYGFLRSPHPWDGRWLVLTVSLPETQRRLRHQLRTRLTWLGLGSPSPGLWVTPDAGHLEAVRQVVEELGLDDQSFAWVGPATGIGDEAQLLDEAWDLATVEELYTTFLRLFEARAPETGTGSFVAQVELVQEWRRFPFLDPDLPRELLDPGWPGLRASELFHDQHQRWHRRAQAEWDRMDQTAAGKA
jgi:phenylacetic acid degradation operon negative regulatory protein